jgi:hypothetical protein
MDNNYEEYEYNKFRYFMAFPFILVAKLCGTIASFISGEIVVVLEPSNIKIQYINEEDYDDEE